jgi:hypothetical protein
MKTLKKIILFFTFAIESVAFSQASATSFSDQALQLLFKNAEQIQLSGDVHADDKLQPILSYLQDFISGKKNYIKQFSHQCYPSQDSLTALCDLIIDYDPIGETGVSYTVSVDANNSPIAIKNNRAEVARGD